jgi:hypothetical protein
LDGQAETRLDLPGGMAVAFENGFFMARMIAVASHRTCDINQGVTVHKASAPNFSSGDHLKRT